jgi:predicted metal-dependent phosphotriesterase family hydrolase
MLTRREFVQRTLFMAAGSTLSASKILTNLPPPGETIVTVLGPVAANEIGFVLTHEHVLVDFTGAENYRQDRYDPDEVCRAALPHLRAVKIKGCTTFVDCTPEYVGRDVRVLKQLAESTGLHILTNTGYYGASQEKYLPPHAYTESAQQLATRWSKEFNEGIDGTTVRPGFIKTGVDKAPLTATHRKLIEAAGIAHLTTGLTIAVHSGDGRAAEEQLAILDSVGVSPRARIWVHAQNEADKTFHIRAAQRDSWVSLDGVNTKTAKSHLELLDIMRTEKLLHRVLVSHDSGWYHVGEPGGGQYNNYNFILDQFIPEMKTQGFTAHEIDTIFRDNPAAAFSVRLRPR